MAAAGRAMPSLETERAREGMMIRSNAKNEDDIRSSLTLLQTRVYNICYFHPAISDACVRK